MVLRRIARVLAIIAHLTLGIALARTVLIWASRCSVRGAHWRAGIAQGWMQRLNRLLHLRIAIHGSVSDTPTLFVANHVSWLDITCLHAVLGANFAAKQEVAPAWARAVPWRNTHMQIADALGIDAAPQLPQAASGAYCQCS